jgi:RNA polymerase sigma-70 factor (ECF subfamily)
MSMLDLALEHALIRKAKLGDADAIESLIRAHQDALYAFILRMSGRPEIAEDVVQESFVRVLGNLDRFDDRFRFSTWVFTIAKRLYVNMRQKQAPLCDTDSLNLHAARAEEPIGISEHSEGLKNARGILDAALASLTDQQREVILLFHQQEWPINDIGAYLNMPEGTVKSHLHRARRRMMRYISKYSSMQARAEELWT